MGDSTLCLDIQGGCKEPETTVDSSCFQKSSPTPLELSLVPPGMLTAWEALCTWLNTSLEHSLVLKKLFCRASGARFSLQNKPGRGRNKPRCSLCVQGAVGKM